MYRGVWRYASIFDLLAIVKASTLSVLVFGLMLHLFGLMPSFGLPGLTIQWLVLVFFLGGSRFAYRLMRQKPWFGPPVDEESCIPVLLFGAGDNAALFLHGFVPKADTEGRSFLLQLHQSLGITIFVVTILRILWTLYSPRPRSFIESPAQLLLHRIVIVALYGAILVQPISGYIASKLAPDFFFVLELPLFNDYADLAQQSLKTLRKTMAFVHGADDGGRSDHPAAAAGRDPDRGAATVRDDRSPAGGGPAWRGPEGHPAVRAGGGGLRHCRGRGQRAGRVDGRAPRGSPLRRP